MSLHPQRSEQTKRPRRALSIAPRADRLQAMPVNQSADALARIRDERWQQFMGTRSSAAALVISVGSMHAVESDEFGLSSRSSGG
jgi:hypothetical protein